MKQSPGFENEKLSNHDYKLSKTSYGLNQALRARYDRLSKFFLEKDFSMAKAGITLFVKKNDQ